MKQILLMISLLLGVGFPAKQDLPAKPIPVPTSRCYFTSSTGSIICPPSAILTKSAPDSPLSDVTSITSCAVSGTTLYDCQNAHTQHSTGGETVRGFLSFGSNDVAPTKLSNILIETGDAPMDFIRIPPHHRLLLKGTITIEPDSDGWGDHD